MTRLNKSSIGVFKRLTKDRVDKAMSNYKNQKAAEPAYGIVKAIKADGSYMVQMNASSTLTRCAPCCTAMVGDRVLVLIKPNGKCDAIGRLGGDLGGGGTIVTKVDDVSNYVAGRVFAHAGTNDPAGALLCDGRAVSRREYWELFDAIGTTYGTGDGSSTFNLPNIESRTIIGESDSYALGATGGEDKHTLTEGELPKLSGRAWFRNWTWGGGSQGSTFLSPDGILKSESGGSTGYDLLSYGSAQGGSTILKAEFGGNQPHNNMQPYIVMRYFITTGKGDPVSGINPADYVVEWGKDETWTWVKYASGIAECWGGYSDWFNVSTEWSGFYYGSFDAIEYPFEFTNAPYEWVTFRAGSNAMYVSPVVNSTTKTHHGYLYCPKSTPSINGWLYFHAKGFWKDSPASGGTETIAPTIAERFEGIETDIDLLKTNKVLWSGASYMAGDQSVTLSEAVSAQPNGIVLMWTYYKNGAAQYFDNSFTFIPKEYVASYANSGVSCYQFNVDSHMAKYVYPSDTTIKGYSHNTGTYTIGNVVFYNSDYVLAQVIGV